MRAADRSPAAVRSRARDAINALQSLRNRHSDVDFTRLHRLNERVLGFDDGNLDAHLGAGPHAILSF